MKHLSLTLLLLLAASGYAQQPQNNSQSKVQESDATDDAKASSKRPSWSQGLPERQAAPVSRIVQTNKVESTETEIDTPSIGEKPLIETQVLSIDFQPQPSSEFKVESQASESKPAASKRVDRKAIFEQYYSSQSRTSDAANQANQPDTIEVNPLIAAYKWQVLKTTPVEVPNSFDKTQPLKVTIQINPQGKVVKVTEADARIPSVVMRHVEKSMLNWRFEAPADIGLSENISRVFEIDIQT